MVDRTAQQADRHAQLSEAVTATLIQMLWALWARVDARGWWDDQLVQSNAQRSATLVMSALKRARTNQRSVLTSVLRDLNALPKSLPSSSTDYVRLGVDPVEVYTRPAKQYQYAFSQGKSFDESRQVAHTRVTSLASTDVVKAQMLESRDVFKASPKVIGSRRIIHPELAKDHLSCGLCVVAATRFYKVDELQPIHDRCNCGVLPITASDDPGLKLNDADLKAMYKAAGSTSAADLLNTRISIHQNGELGPILTRKGDSFRSPSDLPN